MQIPIYRLYIEILRHLLEVRELKRKRLKNQAQLYTIIFSLLTLLSRLVVKTLFHAFLKFPLLKYFVKRITIPSNLKKWRFNAVGKLNSHARPRRLLPTDVILKNSSKLRYSLTSSIARCPASYAALKNSSELRYSCTHSHRPLPRNTSCAHNSAKLRYFRTQAPTTTNRFPPLA